jgi:hypothetical protein
LLEALERKPEVPPDNPKPIRPKQRGEKWMLKDGRLVTYLQLLAVNDQGRCLEVIDERGILDAVYESQFVTKVYPEDLGG